MLWLTREDQVYDNIILAADCCSILSGHEEMIRSTERISGSRDKKNAMECRRLGSAEKNVPMKAHFYSLAEVAQQISDQKIIATQEAYSTYRRTKAKTVQADSETVHPKTATSMNAFEVFFQASEFGSGVSER